MVVSAGAIGFGVALYLQLPEDPPFPTNPGVVEGHPRPDTGLNSPNKSVSVKVLGKGITHQGSYRLSSDSEIVDLVEEAGGLRKGAITSGLRWHQQLYEGLTVIVPTREDFREARSEKQTLTNQNLIRFQSYDRPGERGESSKRNRVNLNEASSSELQSLPGIGSVLSGRIVDYREEHGGFKTVKEIKKVLGIGEATYQDLRTEVEVR